MAVFGWLASFFSFPFPQCQLSGLCPFVCPTHMGSSKTTLLLSLSLPLVTLNTDDYYYEDRFKQTGTTAVGKGKKSSLLLLHSRTQLAHPLSYFNFLLIRCHLINIAIHPQSLSHSLALSLFINVVNSSTNESTGTRGTKVKTLPFSLAFSIFLLSLSLSSFQEEPSERNESDEKELLSGEAKCN